MVEVVETAVGKDKLTKIKAVLGLGGAIDVAVAYLTRSGLDEIRKDLKQALSQNLRVRMVIDLHSGITEPDTLDELVALSRDKGNSFEFRAFWGVNPMFHAKLFLSHTCESVCFLTGSFNLTGRALGSNLEHGLYVKGAASEKVCKEAMRSFDEFWENAINATDDKVKRYRENYHSSIGNLPNPEAWAESRQHLDVNYWLFKCDTKNYTYQELMGKETDTWGDKGDEGPKRDTRSKIWDAVAVGDMALFYEFGRRQPAVVGIIEIVEVLTPDNEIYKRPIFRVKAVREQEPFSPVNLEDLRQIRETLGLSSKNERMSIYGVSTEEWNEILRLGRGEQ